MYVNEHAEVGWGNNGDVNAGLCRCQRGADFANAASCYGHKGAVCLRMRYMPRAEWGTGYVSADACRCQQGSGHGSAADSCRAQAVMVSVNAGSWRWHCSWLQWVCECRGVGSLLSMNV